MIKAVEKELRVCKEDLKTFWREYHSLAWWLAIAILLVYGGRIIHDDFFLDSEIMILRPDFMRYVWMGSNRFGLVATSRIFGMQRLSPWMSNILMACMMWCSGMALAFCAMDWSAHSLRYRKFVFLYPILFVTAPIFVEQYIFVLQAFEVSFGILITILAAFCSNRYSRGESMRWYVVPGLILLVWALGSYQAMAPFYICLILIAFLLGYLNGEAKTALRYGIRQVLFFAVGCALYAVAANVTRKISGTDSTYVSDMIRWRIDGLKPGLSAIIVSIRNVIRGTSVYYRKYYFPAMMMSMLLALYYGWKKKTGIGNLMWYLLGGVLLLLSPFYMNILTGAPQPVRAQLVYPATSALFLAFLTVIPEKKPGAVILPDAVRLSFASLMAAVCVFCAVRQGGDTIQLFQTTWEVYRNDVLTANRMYQDICNVTDGKDMSNCVVVFTGGRSAGVKGPALYGELAGRSMFEAEAHTEVGVSARAGCLFTILGMDMQVTPDNHELYQRAIEFMKDAPDWPESGSIRKMEDVVVVRLSESWI